MQTPQQRQELPVRVWEPQAIGPLWPLRGHREQGTSSRAALTSGALNATGRACYVILHVLGGQEEDMRGARRGTMNLAAWSG